MTAGNKGDVEGQKKSSPRSIIFSCISQERQTSNKISALFTNKREQSAKNCRKKPQKTEKFEKRSPSKYHFLYSSGETDTKQVTVRSISKSITGQLLENSLAAVDMPSQEQSSSSCRRSWSLWARSSSSVTSVATVHNTFPSSCSDATFFMEASKALFWCRCCWLLLLVLMMMVVAAAAGSSARRVVRGLPGNCSPKNLPVSSLCEKMSVSSLAKNLPFGSSPKTCRLAPPKKTCP